mgnify:CR=1 FL=1
MNKIKHIIVRSVLVVLLVAVGGGNLYAQKSQLSGTVSDAENTPLVGASIIVEGTHVGTTTDADGAFRLPAAPGQRLTVSYLGYKSKTVTVGSRTSLDIILESDNSLINEVVVVGYDTQKKVNLTGSVASVSAEDLANRPIVSSSTALQGIAPGVTVTTQSGAPGGDGGMIRVRGIGTFGGSSAAPLVLIDGVEGSLDAVDATQIDQISVLKDAASSAIYGSRAANGVILVTTKRGKKGQTSVTYRGYVGWQSPTDTPETVSAEEYMILSRETSFNDGKESIYTDDYIARYRENNRIDPDNYPLTDWQDQILTGSGFTHNHNLSLTASTERVRVMTSFGYLDQKGIIKRTDYQRYNVRNNMNIDFSDKLSMRFDVSFVNGDRRRIPQQNTLFNYMNTRDPLILSRWSTGYWAGLSGGSTNVLPTLEGEGGNVKNNTIRLNGAVTLTFKPVKWLTLEGMVAPRYVTTNNHTFVKKMKFYSDAFGTVSNSSNVAFNYLDESANRSFYGNYQFTAALQHTFAQNHNFKLLLGASRETYDNKTLSAHREDFAYPDYEVIGAGADNETKDNGGGHAQWALQSFFGRLNYNFKERYLFEANVRFDGSSRFAKGNRWGIFPSFSGAWRLTEEPFMQDVRRTLSEFKIRASYGQLGNQNIGSNYPTIQQLDVSSISVNDVITPIVTQTTLANPDITWERAKKYDVGIEARFFRNRLSLVADWFREDRRNILTTLGTIPIIYGVSSDKVPPVNVGITKNQGYELLLSWEDQIGNWRYSLSGDVSYSRNKIVYKAEAENPYPWMNQTGFSIGQRFGLVSDGFFNTNEELANRPYNTYTANRATLGDIRYVDLNGDGLIDNKDIAPIGYPNYPEYHFNVKASVGWKGFDLRVLFIGTANGSYYLNSGYTMPFFKRAGNAWKWMYDGRWTAERYAAGKKITFPRMTFDTTSSDNNYLTSDFWMKSSNFFKIKNIELGYTFDMTRGRLARSRIRALRVYFNANNVYTFKNELTDIGIDPETTDGSTYIYPLTSVFSFGINLKF